MNKPIRVLLLVAFCAAIAVILVARYSPLAPSISTTLAPPGPADLGPATGLSEPPAGAAVFDLRYLPQTGAANEIEYHSYWGFGGSRQEAEDDRFLQDVGRRISRLYYVNNPTFKGREWAAVEHRSRQAVALYFDLNADGKFQDAERILPTRKTDQGCEFITPDFIQPLEKAGQTLCRTLLRVDFYQGNSEPNCMWSPAALMEGTANFNGQSARLLLFARSPGGEFDKFGSSGYSLQFAEPVGYVPRESLSTLISHGGQFYHLSVEGKRSNGLPARVLLVKDDSPTGALVVKLASSGSHSARVTSVSLHGLEESTVFLRIGGLKGSMLLPEGAYAVDTGTVSYGASEAHDWEVSFSQGPRANVQAGEPVEVALGQPAIEVRAVEDRDRYNQQATSKASFKKGTRIYLEPRVVGRNGEVFTRFRQPARNRSNKDDRPPRITITDANGKQVLSKVMEYG